MHYDELWTLIAQGDFEGAAKYLGEKHTKDPSAQFLTKFINAEQSYMSFEYFSSSLRKSQALSSIYITLEKEAKDLNHSNLNVDYLIQLRLMLMDLYQLLPGKLLTYAESAILSSNILLNFLHTDILSKFNILGNIIRQEAVAIANLIIANQNIGSHNFLESVVYHFNGKQALQNWEISTNARKTVFVLS